MIDVYKRIDNNTIILELDDNIYKAIRHINGKLIASIASTIELALIELDKCDE